jgi:hypothetical protein
VVVHFRLFPRHEAHKSIGGKRSFALRLDTCSELLIKAGQTPKSFERFSTLNRNDALAKVANCDILILPCSVKCIHFARRVLSPANSVLSLRYPASSGSSSPVCFAFGYDSARRSSLSLLPDSLPVSSVNRCFCLFVGSFISHSSFRSLFPSLHSQTLLSFVVRRSLLSVHIWRHRKWLFILFQFS